MWKVIKQCKNYEVSNYGDIRRIDTGKILKQKLDVNNNLIATISMGARNKVKYFTVSRLVAEAFVPNPENLPWVTHIDGNPLNNEASNLKWIQSRRPSNDQPNGEQSHNAKLTKEQVEWCRNVYKPRDKEYGVTPLAKRFDVGKSTMSYILNNLTYK